MNTKHLGFTPFAKVEPQDDGSVLVTGVVSTEALDADGQITDLSWIRGQMAEWQRFGNIREMHQPSAVGKGVEWHDLPDGGGIELVSRIVDPVAAMKCREGVYTGYSWGGKSIPGNPMRVVKDSQAPNGRIVGGALIEISVVDRPANPEAVFNLVKADLAVAPDDWKALAIDFGEAVKGEPDMRMQEAFQTIEDYEFDDAQLMLVTANLVRYIMLRRLHEPHEGDLEYWLMLMGSIYDTLVRESRSEAVESWEGLASRVIAGLDTSHTIDAILGEAADGIVRGTTSDVLAAFKDAAESYCTDCRSTTCAADCACGKCSSMKGVTDVDKTELMEIVKGLTAEERVELGLVDATEGVSKADFEALKATLADTQAQLLELGKRATPGGPSLKPAAPTPEVTPELEAAKSEHAQLEKLIQSAAPEDVPFYEQRRDAAAERMKALLPA